MNEDDVKTVKFRTTQIVKNEEVTFVLPDMTDQGYLPTLISFNETGNIGVKVMVGGVTVVSRGQPFFSVTDELELSDYMKEITTGRLVTLKVTNKYHKSQEVNVTVSYSEHQGAVIYENVIDDSDLPTLLSNIADLGTLSQLVITSSVRLKSAKLVPTISDDFGIMTGATIPIKDNNDTSRLMVSMIGCKLQKYIRWSQIQIEPIKKLGDDEMIILNVLAFGYAL